MATTHNKNIVFLLLFLVALVLVDIKARWTQDCFNLNYAKEAVPEDLEEKASEGKEHAPPNIVYNPIIKNKINEEERPTASPELDRIQNGLAVQMTGVVSNPELTDAELDYVLKGVKLGPKLDLKCKIQKDIFFLKSSKTGSTTMMSIFQRFGLKYNSRFLMGENRGGMAVNSRPVNLESDCWLGKNIEGLKFDLSCNHLHWNKTMIDALMVEGYKSIGIAREPNSHFISSFNFYHNLMPKFTYMLNPSAPYNQKRRRVLSRKQLMSLKPTKEDITNEMKEFLRNPWFYLSDMGNNSFAYMANVRPQLLFYGKSRNNIASYDQELTREEVLDWIQDIMAGFDLMMVLEYFDYSLAMISLQFCIPPEDLVYIAVNQRHETTSGKKKTLPLDDEDLHRLKELNWPDYLLYQALNTTFWKRVDFYGEDLVKERAEKIVELSNQISSECIDYEREGANKLVDRVFLMEGKESNSTCLQLQFQGVRATKLFMVNQVEELRNMTKNKYKFCGPKIVYGEYAGRYLEWRDNYLRMYKAVKGDFD